MQVAAVRSAGRALPDRTCVGLAMPGGFEHGGIGRMMLYVTRAWAVWPEAPDWRVIDARGQGAIGGMPLHLGKALAQLGAAALAGRLDLLHINVAGRGSTLRKIVLGAAAARLRLPTVVHLHDYDYAAYLAACPATVRR